VGALAITVFGHVGTAQAAIASVQTGTEATATNATITPTLASASTAGNLLVAVVANGTDCAAFTAPANWVKATGTCSSGNTTGQVSIWYYPNNPGGISSATFTAASGTKSIVGQLSEWSGVATLSPLDQTGTASAAVTQASLTVSTRGATQSSGELAITGFSTGHAGMTSFTSGGSFSSLFSDLTNGYRADKQLGAAAGTVSETESGAPNEKWIGVIATFSPVPYSTPAGIALRSSTSSLTSTAGTSVVLNVPDAVAAGDVLLAQVAIHYDKTPTITAPSGWTFIRQDTGGSAGSSVSDALYYRVATGTEPSSYTWTLSQVETSAGGIASYTGVNIDNPVDISGASVGASGTTLTAPSVTTTNANDMLLALFGDGKPNTTVTNPTGMTQEWDQFNAAAGTIDASMSDVLQASAGASGTKVATGGNAGWTAQLVALNAGALTLVSSGNPSFALTLNGQSQTASYTNPLTLGDTRGGSTAGWNLTATSTQFTTSGGKTLPTNASTVTGVTNSCAATCVNPTNSVTYPLNLPAGAGPPTAVKVYNAAGGSGSGTFTVTPTVQVAVPTTTFLGTYTSTLTFSFDTGP
jgi:MSHA biogenesis protein MshQ